MPYCGAVSDVPGDSEAGGTGMEYVPDCGGMLVGSDQKRVVPESYCLLPFRFESFVIGENTSD